MYLRLLTALAIAAALPAQKPVDAQELLRLTQTSVKNSAARLPRFMCTETIDRIQYERDKLRPNPQCRDDPEGRKVHPFASDRLRLDVAMGQEREMFAWFGERKFTDRELLEIVHEGAVSTGTFAGFLRGIFDTEKAEFNYTGPATLDGRSLAEFKYKVVYENSHYLYGPADHRVTIPYDGTFLVDPKDGDLVRLVVHSDQIPGDTGACSATTTLDYFRVRMQDTQLHDTQFLLPRAVVLRIVHRTGVAENRTVFSGCHEFLGESTLRFDAPPDNEAPATKALPLGASLGANLAPAGIPFRVVLTQGVDTATAAAGDTLQAELATPIAVSSKVLIPAGARIVARIMRLRQIHGKAPSLTLDIRLESVEVGGVAVPLSAKPNWGLAFPKAFGSVLKGGLDLGSLSTLEERTFAFWFANAQPRFLIRTGLESSWVTTDSALH